MTSYIGLFMLIALFGGIFLLGRKTSRDAAAFWAAIAESGFRTSAQLPAEWLADFGYLTVKSGVLMEGRPQALLLVGHLRGTSISTGSGQVGSVDEYLGYALTSEWGLSATQCAELVKRAKPFAERTLPSGACLLLWKKSHTTAHLRALLEMARRDVAAVGGEIPTRQTVAIPKTVTAPHAAPVHTPELSDSFVVDNMWPWRKENNPGLEELPPEALQPQIRRISLHFHALSKLPAEIGLLENLEEITLFQTEVSELPEEIGMCSKLRTISISQSNLKSLPASLFRLPRLEALNLTRNGMVSLPEEIGMLSSLRELILNANPLTALPESLGRLSNLEVLGIACYKLEILPECVASMGRLKELVLHEGGPLAGQIERWKEALPNAKVRFAGLMEITAIG